MKKSWFHYLADILSAILIVALPIILFLIYLSQFGSRYSNLVINKIFNFKMNQFIPPLFFSALIALAMQAASWWIRYYGQMRELISSEQATFIKSYSNKISIIIFLLSFSITALNESQFSLIMGIIAFYSLVTSTVFKK